MNEENQTTPPENHSEGATLMGQAVETPTGAEAPANESQSQAAPGQQVAETTAAEEKAPEMAPEKYEFAPPEGKEYDPEVISSFSEAAKEANLSQEKAQKLLDHMAPKIAERQTRQIESVKAQWAESAKADKEFGGEKLAENMGMAKKALNQFGSPELLSLLEDSGLGNHPEVIRFFYKAGKAISEDSFVGGSKTDGVVKDPAKILYPGMA